MRFKKKDIVKKYFFRGENWFWKKNRIFFWKSNSRFLKKKSSWKFSIENRTFFIGNFSTQKNFINNFRFSRKKSHIFFPKSNFSTKKKYFSMRFFLNLIYSSSAFQRTRLELQRTKNTSLANGNVSETRTRFFFFRNLEFL